MAPTILIRVLTVVIAVCMVTRIALGQPVTTSTIGSDSVSRCDVTTSTTWRDLAIVWRCRAKESDGYRRACVASYGACQSELTRQPATVEVERVPEWIPWVAGIGFAVTFVGGAIFGIWAQSQIGQQ